jgi:hypothetical protein
VATKVCQALPGGVSVCGYPRDVHAGSDRHGRQGMALQADSVKTCESAYDLALDTMISLTALNVCFRFQVPPLRLGVRAADAGDATGAAEARGGPAAAVWVGRAGQKALGSYLVHSTHDTLVSNFLKGTFINSEQFLPGPGRRWWPLGVRRRTLVRAPSRRCPCRAGSVSRTGAPTPWVGPVRCYPQRISTRSNPSFIGLNDILCCYIIYNVHRATMRFTW